LFERTQQDGQIEFAYETCVYVGYASAQQPEGRA
jgi:hypothetical protein